VADGTGLVFVLLLVIGVGIVVLILRQQRAATLRLPGLGSPSTPATVHAPTGVELTAVPPSRLPTFKEIGGMDELKREMLDTFGLILGHADEAAAYRISWNGVLFHGPPGVGKSFFARALAGQLDLTLIEVATADVVSRHVGAGPELVEQVFTFARHHEPALLLFDELDAVAGRRDDDDGRSRRDVLMQLLQSVEATHGDRRLLVAATTNDVEALDPAVIRPGRFDRHVRLDLPDRAGRAAILTVALAGRPVAEDVDVAELAEHSRGRTPAALATAVEGAALAAFRQSAGTGRIVRITKDHLLAALERAGGHDRPLVEDWSWSRLVLPAGTAAELREVQAMIEDPERCRQYGVDQPSGLLLTGPPGTGKTTIAKVLAAEADCSFYPVTGADITSRFVGESERLIARLFDRARDNAPSIVFIDEIDAIGSTRGELGAYDRQLDQLLQEMDGMSGQGGIFVIAATNRPDRIDPALLRGGRLSRTLQIPLPDLEARREMLRLLTAPMPLSGVDLDHLAAETGGFSGADLKALCQQAALEAMVRSGDDAGPVAVTAADVAAALADEVAERAAAGGGRPPRRPRRAPGH
jgi:transitional endoplasmic reticulum ATPase